MTRDEEIEALAQMHWASSEDAEMWQCLASAEKAIETVHHWRAARQPAPETPTPRIEVLKRWLECCHALGIYAVMVVERDGYAYEPECIMDAAMHRREPRVNHEEAFALRQHAATLKERKEKADGA